MPNDLLTLNHLTNERSPPEIYRRGIIKSHYSRHNFIRAIVMAILWLKSDALISGAVRLIRAAGIVLLSAAVLVCCIALFYIWQWHERTPTATTLAGLSRTEIPLVQLLSVKANGTEFYLWISTPISFFGMPSEPTVYAFDSRGKLLDWNLEADEWKSVGYYYNERQNGIPVRIEDAIGRINKLEPIPLLGKPAVAPR